MTQYIDKDALVAKIKRRIKINKECMLGLRNLDYYQGKVDALNDTISSLNSLEVKEVDLDKELDIVEDKYRGFESLSRADVIAVAKHFFELGLRASLTEGKYIGNVKGSYTTTTEFKT